MVRLEVSFGTWEPDPVLYMFFRSEMTFCSVWQNVDTELGQAPASQARPRDTDHLRPSYLAARTLRSVEHTPSSFGHDPCAVRRGLMTAVNCCVRKARFFDVRAKAVEQNRSQSVVWVFQHHQRENLFLFSVSDPIIVGLKNTYAVTKTLIEGVSSSSTLVRSLFGKPST